MRDACLALTHPIRPKQALGRLRSVAKQATSIYQPGEHTGYWTKTRINVAQEFVIGGFVKSNRGVDSIVGGFYKGKELHYAARVRAGFVPATRGMVFDAIKYLKLARSPFVNLPEKEPGVGVKDSPPR